MPESNDLARPHAESTRGEISDFVDLTKRYVIQETVGPLKTIGRTLAFGSAAAIMFGLSSIVAMIGVLRVLQTETGPHFTGELTWLPYLITIGTGVLILGVAAAILLRSPKPSRRRPTETS